jgi:hypothetical protein
VQNDGKLSSRGDLVFAQSASLREPDVPGFARLLDDELIDRAVEHDRPLELPPQEGISYQAFTDPSGGVGSDSYTVAIGHKAGDRLITDVCRGTIGKFDPQEVTKQYAALLREYRISKVVGDAYGAEWVAAAWRDCGFEYQQSPKPKSAIYIECIPLFARGLVSLPDHLKLLRECLSATRTVPARTRSIIRATATTTTPMWFVVSCICYRSRWSTTTKFHG